MKYTWHGSEAFDAFLEANLQELAADAVKILGNNLAALVLAGGYGRGEGGIIMVNGVEKPYNDLDLIPILKNSDRSAVSALLPVSRKFADKLAIHVDFSRPMTESDLRALPHKLMWQDLLNGHIVFSGEADILTRNMPESLRKPLPIIEATHLMLNRGAGLVWSIGILEGYLPCEDADFARRNYFKAALAIGDALLIANCRHQTRYRGRDKLLETLAAEVTFPHQSQILALYRRALAFKFSPDLEDAFVADFPKLRELAEFFVDILILIESRRMGIRFASVADYCATTAIREASEHRLAKLPRNLFYNLRQGRLSILYPRERLYRLLPALLSDDSKNCGWNEKCRNFLQIWEKFN